jgi:hypothetical protein
MVHHLQNSAGCKYAPYSIDCFGGYINAAYCRCIVFSMWCSAYISVHFFIFFFFRARRHNFPGMHLSRRLISYEEAEVPYWGLLISFGLTSRFPKTLKCWWANTSQQQIIYCTVSSSFLQNLQVGSPSNRPMVRRCILTGARLVRITTTILSWCLFSLSGSSALFLHGLPIKSLPCLWPGKSLQALSIHVVRTLSLATRIVRAIQ